MAQKWMRVALLGAFGAVVLALSVGAGASAQDKKAPPVKEIMKAGHKGDDAHMAKVVLAVKDGRWEDAQKHAKQLADNGTVIGKNMVKKGDPKSWEALTTKYAANTKALYTATEKKDAKDAKTALENLGASCKECHTAHRGK
jgi:cytochrome c556